MKIQTKNLNVFYGKKQILYGVDSSIEEHKITALVGQSGCGKSTFLKALNRIVEEEGGRIEGEILADKTDVMKMTTEELRSRVGLVFQQPVVFPCSIEKNLLYVLNYHFKLSKAECKEKVIKNLKAARIYEEVKDQLSMPARKLSGGQKQRLAVARSLCADPEILLLDEPCSALDMNNTIAIEEMLEGLKQNYSILIVTHNLSQAQRIADDIIYMHQGKIIETAKKEDFFRNPKTQEARDYIKYM